MNLVLSDKGVKQLPCQGLAAYSIFSAHRSTNKLMYRYSTYNTALLGIKSACMVHTSQMTLAKFHVLGILA